MTRYPLDFWAVKLLFCKNSLGGDYALPRLPYTYTYSSHSLPFTRQAFLSPTGVWWPQDGAIERT